MTAKEFKEKEGYGNFWKNELEIDEDYIFEFAEAYNKSKIEAISDEELTKGYNKTCKDLNIFPNEDYVMGLKVGANYVKEQLLKQ